MSQNDSIWFCLRAHSYPASQPVQYEDWSARGKPVTPAKKNVLGATPAKQFRASAVGDRPPQSISIIVEPS